MMDLIRGRVAPPRFASRMTRALRRAGVREAVRYVPDGFALQIGTDPTQPWTIFLQNTYEQYLATPRLQRRRMLDAFAQSTLNRADLPETYEEARRFLRPQVREPFFHEACSLGYRLGRFGMDDPAMPNRVFAEHLTFNLAVDQPQTIASITDEQLQQWNVTFDAALEVATDNLWRISNERWRQPGKGVHVSPWQDSWDASRLFLHDLIWQLEGKGAHVAAAPNRDMVIVTGEDDPEGLTQLAALTESVYAEQPRPMTGFVFVLRDRQWQPFMPPADHPSRPAFEKLRLMAESGMYSEQQALLQALHEQEGPDVFVASYNAAEDANGLFSYTIWPEGVPTYLPKADRVALIRTDASGAPGKTLGFAEWGQLQSVVGDLLRPLGPYPERYEVHTFPGPEQLAQLALEAVA